VFAQIEDADRVMENNLETALIVLGIGLAIAAVILLWRRLLARWGDYWKWLS